MPFGDILSGFEIIELEDAEGNNFRTRNNIISKLAFKIIGIPHIGIKIRARKIMKEVAKLKGKFLDAGCGFGLYSFTLRKKGFEVYAIDNSRRRVEFLRKNGINAKVMDVTKLKFNKDYFDVIICSDVLEHVKNDKKAFSELARVLKKRGKLIITLPYYSQNNMKVYKKFSHERAGYKTEDIKNMADENGLKIEKLSLYSSYPGEFAFKLNRILYKNNILLGIFFYPIYLVSFIEDLVRFDKKSYNGLFAVLSKNL